MNLELQTRAFDLYISELDSYLGVHDSVQVDHKVSRTRSIDWQMNVYSIANAAIDEIKFSTKRVCFSLLWEIDLDSLEEYEALRLQKEHNATIGGKTVFGQIIIDSLQLDYDHSIDVDLQQNNAFFCKPDTVWVYLDSKKIEVECRN
jgi:hypothetical protein